MRLPGSGGQAAWPGSALDVACLSRPHPRRMAGLTALSFLLLLVVIGFFALLVIRLFPVYLEYFNVTSSLKAVQGEAQMESLSNAEIKTRLLRRFEVNDVAHVGRQDIRIETEADKRKIIVAYEVREPFLGNVDLVVSFDEQVEIRGR